MAEEESGRPPLWRPSLSSSKAAKIPSITGDLQGISQEGPTRLKATTRAPLPPIMEEERGLPSRRRRCDMRGLVVVDLRIRCIGPHTPLVWGDRRPVRTARKPHLLACQEPTLFGVPRQPANPLRTQEQRQKASSSPGHMPTLSRHSLPHRNTSPQSPFSRFDTPSSNPPLSAQAHSQRPPLLPPPFPPPSLPNNPQRREPAQQAAGSHFPLPRATPAPRASHPHSSVLPAASSGVPGGRVRSRQREGESGRRA